MNNLDATPLSERIAQGPLSAAEALHAAGALAGTLRRLHASGVVHGALEPGRVILNESGASLVAGVGAPNLTPYSSPEQARGEAADVRSDIFAFGAILYEMLTGRRAFAGEGDELRQSILEQQPVEIAGDSSGLVRLMMRCLAKAPAQRWQRVQNLQMELKLLQVMARRVEQTPEAQEQRWRAMLRQEIAQVEATLRSRIDGLESASVELKAELAEEAEKLRLTAESAHTLQRDVAALAARIESVDQEKSQASAHAAEALAGVTGRLDGVDRALAAHGSSIESLGTAVTQSEDLIERLVDAFDTMERSLNAEGEATATMAAGSP